MPYAFPILRFDILKGGNTNNVSVYSRLRLINDHLYALYYILSYPNLHDVEGRFNEVLFKLYLEKTH